MIAQMLIAVKVPAKMASPPTLANVKEGGKETIANQTLMIVQE